MSDQFKIGNSQSSNCSTSTKYHMFSQVTTILKLLDPVCCPDDRKIVGRHFVGVGVKYAFSVLTVAGLSGIR